MSRIVADSEHCFPSRTRVTSHHDGPVVQKFLFTQSYPQVGGVEDSLHSLLTLKRDELTCIANRVRDYVGTTRVITTTLNYFGVNGIKISAKLENETPSGSFKIRGASYCLDFLSKTYPNKQLSIFIASTGNHGISLAVIANQLGCKVTVVVPDATAGYKKKQILDYGADLVCAGSYLDESLQIAEALAIKHGGLFIDSSHHLLIAGNSSCIFELFQQIDDEIDYLFLPMGVGSFISGAVITNRVLSKKTKIIGIVPELCAGWIKSWAEKRPILVLPSNTAATGLKTAQPTSSIFQFLFHSLDRIISVSEKEIFEAKNLCFDSFGKNSTPTGVVGLAGLIKFTLHHQSIKHAATVIGE